MWLVRLALSRPYTFIVMAIFLMMLGVISLLRMPVDIFPVIKSPVVGVVWNYNGLPPDEMSSRITTIFERGLYNLVNNIEHVDSTSILGMSTVKIYLHPSTDVPTALAQILSTSQYVLRLMPPGTFAPMILNYDASTVPVISLVLSSKTLSEQKIFDLGNNFIRNYLATIPGAMIPSPYGGKLRQVVADIDNEALQNYGLSAQNIVSAIDAQSSILPAGTQKIGPYEFVVKLNNSPKTIQEYNELPLFPGNNKSLYIRDVAHIRDGFYPQINLVRVNSERAILMNIAKLGNTSTLALIEKLKKLMPTIKANMPDSLNLSLIGDQSIFVKASILNVVSEGITASLLTGLLIFLFTGNLRNTLIITISIPLSIFSALIVLHGLGQTINIMTLGGLALAIGILVDDATVEIENINRQLRLGKPMQQAILDGAAQIAVPAFVSTLCICVVFLPMFFLQGITAYLFEPFAMSVMFAVFSSYVLSRTLVPTLARYFLVNEKAFHQSKLHQWFENRFELLRSCYLNFLNHSLEHAFDFVLYFMGVVVLLCFLASFLGENFFPNVDASEIKLHVRAKSGTRIEETAKYCAQVEREIRGIIPKNELANVMVNVGLPISGVNLIYNNSAIDGPQDADIQITLKKNHHSLEAYAHQLRDVLHQKFPELGLYFLPADIVNQILNFGLPSIINLQINGFKYEKNMSFAHEFLQELRKIPGITDVRIREVGDYPSIQVDVDRSQAREIGLSEADIVKDVYISLSGSFQTNPNFWLDPKNGVSYQVVSQTPQFAMSSIQDLKNIPFKNVTTTSGRQILGAVADMQFKQVPAALSHYNVQPVINIFSSIEQRDIGSVSKDIEHLIEKMQPKLPKGSEIRMKGQVSVLKKSYNHLFWGLLFSLVIVYLFMVINFQSLIEPLVIIAALPAALAGICLSLFITNTAISVPAIIGTFMTIGIGIANSILMVSFAKQYLDEHPNALEAVCMAAKTRFRPIIMTATAMMVGMLPIALGFGEGAEQNAPIGRAVIGGLLFATCATLFFVPNVFYLIYSKLKKPDDETKHS